MKYCTKCGTQIDDDAFFCTHCGNQQPIPNFQEKAFIPSNNNETNNTNHEFNLQNSQRQPKQPFPTKLIATIAVISAIAIIGIVAIITTCKHEWIAATCTEPQTCVLCGDTKGKSLGHDFINATCTSPKTCKVCQTTEGNSIGHIEGDWVITKNPTLINTGAEELSCNVCGKLIDTRTIQKKSPQVDNDYFNFTDSELIDWINDITTCYVYSTDLGVFDKDSPNTSYKIDFDGETGALILNHGDNTKDGNIQAIMVYFEKTTTASSLVIFLGGKIDSNFDTDDAIYNVVYGKSYSAADMTVLELELSNDFIVGFLAPTTYLENLE